MNLPGAAAVVDRPAADALRRQHSVGVLGGVAWVSTTITASSPTKTPVFGSPSAVKA